MSRTFIATVIGLLGFAAYVVAVLAAADAITPLHLYPGFWAVQAVFFVIAGTAWVFPAKALLYWAARKSPPIRPSRK